MESKDVNFTIFFGTREKKTLFMASKSHDKYFLFQPLTVRKKLTL